MGWGAVMSADVPVGRWATACSAWAGQQSSPPGAVPPRLWAHPPPRSTGRQSHVVPCSRSPRLTRPYAACQQLAPAVLFANHLSGHKLTSRTPDLHAW
jgi:hypothetical protein